MNDGLRQRSSKNKSHPLVGKEKSLGKASSSKTNSTRWIYAALLGAGSLFLTLYPRTFLELARPWWSSLTPQVLPGTPATNQIVLGADVARRDAVVEAFKYAWHAYERDAFGCDEYHPLTHKGSNMTEGYGYGYTIVDTLDTILIMNLTDEYTRVHRWIDEELSFDIDGIYNVFETNIRVLGGLLSAFYLTQDQLYLARSVDLADRLMSAFVTPSGLPVTMVNLAKRLAVPDTNNGNLVSSAEVGTLQLEFRYLSHVTGNDTYWEAAENIMKVIERALPSPPLVSIFMSPESGQFMKSAIRLGSRADSLYEYLLKQYLQTGRAEHGLRRMYDLTMDAINEHLVKRTPQRKLLYTSELVPEGPNSDVQWRMVPKQDHLVCFLGGLLMLGAADGGFTSIPPLPSELSESAMRDWTNGYELIKTCMETHKTATGLSPEIAHFRSPNDPPIVIDNTPSDWYIKGSRERIASWDARYSLRPETVESLFVAFRLTGDQRYRDWGWDIFQAIERHCKIESGGYASVLNVDSVDTKWDDKMETFLLSETFKYLYLLFEDASVLPLTENVFNTEAHPLPVFNLSERTHFS